MSSLRQNVLIWTNSICNDPISIEVHVRKWGRLTLQSVNLETQFTPESESESRPVVSNSLRPYGSTVHGILQARILEWASFSFSRGSSQPRDLIQVSCIAGRFFTSWATREAQEYWSGSIPFPADLPNLGIEPGSHALQVDSLPNELWGKPNSPLAALFLCDCKDKFPQFHVFSFLNFSFSSLRIMGRFFTIWAHQGSPMEDWGQEEKGAVEDKIVGWHYQLNRYVRADFRR